MIKLRKIKIGELVSCCKGIKAVIGAIIKNKNSFKIITSYHVLKICGCKEGSEVYINRFKGKVQKIFKNLDIALLSFNIPSDFVLTSEIGNPKLGSAYILRRGHKKPCKIIDIGKTFHKLSFPARKLPVPGDSGSPVIQDGKVVGILSSIYYTNATAIASSLEKFLERK
ncbi:conserved hypothetical protein [Methanothermus fervidus DSM 2088]|uniref:Uncharacterized protein n=1 Tax=Methanothermus fervidus (strain ATCC 43054 / DSM 2088 / JCM 10308 / V24 S) TaxID=523846 RepID=E3GWL8_METFV|nr:conserved hypothetical protein [Methanothermus fervidus DSM 2088]